MDKQTAIDLLDNLLGMVEDNHESDYDTAIKMGIDALKEKTQLSKEDATKDATFDCISRRAVIDELNVLCQEHRYRIPGKRETYSEYNEAWQDALDRAEGVIFNLPSVQPQRWIPVTEALPEKDGQYVVCSDGYVFPAIYHQRGVYDGNVVWSDYHWTDLETGIIQQIEAWMPLPEPWRGGQDG